MKHLKQMLDDPDLPSVLAAPLQDAVSHVWPAIRAAQQAGDFDAAERIVREALDGAMPHTIAIFEARVASATGDKFQ
ncbi:hypothetical protein NKH54_22575 [Mesorhizobium sp. M1004]|uniref:hypothetical protein n=1 Tax=Mesorhizobium sp. M1004 TaxID=2957046 RepID=UPI003338A269